MNFRTLDLNLLRVFDAVMAEGSLTRAATALSMTQPALSHALKRLHQSVGEELFTRGARGMQPTPHAQALWPQVRAALASLRQALAPDEFSPQADAVNFRLALADATAALLAPALVATIEQERALANLEFVPLTTRDPRPLIEHGEVDLALGHFPWVLPALQAQGPQAKLRHARLYETDYVCAMRRDHPLARQPLTLDAFCAAHHLLVSYSGAPYGLVDEALGTLGRQRRIVLTVNQFFTAGRVVTRSDLLTVLPRHFLPATGFQEELTVQPLPLTLAPVQVEMLWHVRQDTDPAQRWLRQCVLEAAAAQ
ncbi:LysR family transcriptional regulator [Azohydromonas caseinilytica]|uniref:LysR family transcriptional regulator n=1 Tax=Azohydromonas caseinilytica TaxID=2728836 RepID=A0A848F436_9BURK|nr:LysR family transcriptional regulator [Azohydromonas caseinilytica]NML13838.1 LysR family transcriptional regulator [Azohydromonas caseinilytica]